MEIKKTLQSDAAFFGGRFELFLVLRQYIIENRKMSHEGKETMDAENFVKEYGKGLYSFCLFITRDKENADELYQQTFLVAFEKNEMDENDNPKSYLITIALNLWKNRMRRMARRKKIADVSFMEDGDMSRIADGHASVEDEVERRQEAERLRRCVLELPEKYRLVILMYYMEELSLEEIADALRIPLGTVKSRLAKARKMLKERYDYE